MSADHIQATGNIGGHFTRALLQTGKHTVTALTREGSDKAVPEGAKVVKVNYDDDDSLVEALRGQQFLIIALGVSIPADLHSRIVAAAAKAGVQYVMPNSFGGPIIEDPTAGAWLQTHIARKKEIDNTPLSRVTLVCSFFYEWSVALGDSWFGFEIKDRKVTFFDDGRRAIKTSTWDQCGRAVAALLSLPESGATPSVSDFKRNDVSISSFCVSQRDILDSLHRVLGTTDSDWTISYESSAQRIADGAEELKRGVQSGFAKMLYGEYFLPGSKKSEYVDTETKLLGLPQESLDEATKRAVAMVEDGFSPFQ